MKYPILFFLLLVWATDAFSVAANYLPAVMQQPVYSETSPTMQDRFPSELKGKKAGKKWSAKKKNKKETSGKEPGIVAPTSKKKGKSQVTALLLAMFLGIFGAHRFYLGYYGYGAIMFLTLGLYGILTAVDLVLIVSGNLHPKYEAYSEWLD